MFDTAQAVIITAGVCSPAFFMIGAFFTGSRADRIRGQRDATAKALESVTNECRALRVKVNARSEAVAKGNRTRRANRIARGEG